MLTLCVNIIGYLSPAFLGPEGSSLLLIHLLPAHGNVTRVEMSTWLICAKVSEMCIRDSHLRVRGCPLTPSKVLGIGIFGLPLDFSFCKDLSPVLLHRSKQGNIQRLTDVC